VESPPQAEAPHVPSCLPQAAVWPEPREAPHGELPPALPLRSLAALAALVGNDFVTPLQLAPG
jgi:hypothetical protein